VPGPGGTEIVLVEDNPNDLELTLRALQSRNLANNVWVARDGAEALEYFFGNGASESARSTAPKLILLDLKLPRVDGLEVLQRLKSDPRTKAVPVVVLTSSREGPDVATAYALGVNSYIVKPVAFEAFARAIVDVGLYWLQLNVRP
jgi:CheY-like chemotaxis protein